MAYETVHGYCWPQSVVGGEQIGLHLSSPGSRPVRVVVARVGAERTVVARCEIEAEDHPVPTDAAARGCDWPVAARLTVEPGWRSGYYEVALEVEVDGKRRRNCAFFVVRPPIAAPTSSMLLTLSTNTWNAYNDFGGSNLYTGGTHVSFRRPMGRGFLHQPEGRGQRIATIGPPDPRMVAHYGYLQLHRLSPFAGQGGWPAWEKPFLEWAERTGYAIDVATNADLEDHPDLLDPAHYRLHLSVGHDEYWTAAMRDTVEGFTARGGNAAFLSGNTAFWQVRLEDRPSEGGPAATMVGYKARFKRDPVYGTDRQSELTSIWSDHLIERPENRMTGLSYARGGLHRITRRAAAGAGGYTIHRPDHWLFDGTGLGYGDLLGADATVVGYECDGCDFTYRDGLPYPTGSDGTPTDFTILGTAPAAMNTRETALQPLPPGVPSEVEFVAARLFHGSREPADVARVSHGHAVLGTFTTPGGGTVVNSGTTEWVHGLSGRDPQVEQITRNILERLGSR